MTVRLMARCNKIICKADLGDKMGLTTILVGINSLIIGIVLGLVIAGRAVNKIWEKKFEERLKDE